jgi:hypothetical protein
MAQIKRSECILIMYLVFAIIGTFAVGGASCFEHSNKGLDTNRYFSAMSHTVDWLAEDTTTIGKAHGSANSPLRNGLLRVFILAGTIVAAVYLARANLKIIKNENFLPVKKLILLKLRI